MTKENLFKSLIVEATKIVKEVAPTSDGDDDKHKASLRLSEHFPGLYEMSKELQQDQDFLVDAGVGSEMMAVNFTSKSPEEVEYNMSASLMLNQSKLGIFHRHSIRFAVLLGLELGYIISKLYDKQTTSDDEFDKFMKSLGMDTPPEGSVQ